MTFPKIERYAAQIVPALLMLLGLVGAVGMVGLRVI